MRTPAQKRAASFEQIRQRGAPFVLSRAPKAYNAATSHMEQGPTQKWEGWAADWEIDASADDLSQRIDLRLILAAEGMTDPLPNDAATYAGVGYVVQSAAAIRQAGVAIVYDVRLRKG